jgi:uncharacterized protein (DUF305 family)
MTLPTLRAMKASRTSRVGVAVLGALALSACAGGPPAGPQPPPSTSVAATSNADIEALYRARTDSARMRFTDADVRFMNGMIGHHAQALIMSGMAPSHGASSAVQRLASRIINAQNDEIATMQRWLRERGQHVPEVHLMGLEVMIDDHEHAMYMPGMLNADEMRSLDAARGVDFDRLFLTGMIKHHSGAVGMVHDLFATDGAAQDEMAFKLANAVHGDQTTEIARMQRMLAAIPGEDRTP